MNDSIAPISNSIGWSGRPATVEAPRRGVSRTRRGRRGWHERGRDQALERCHAPHDTYGGRRSPKRPPHRRLRARVTRGRAFDGRRLRRPGARLGAELQVSDCLFRSNQLENLVDERIYTPRGRIQRRLWGVSGNVLTVNRPNGHWVIGPDRPGDVKLSDNQITAPRPIQPMTDDRRFGGGFGRKPGLRSSLGSRRTT